VFAGLSNWFDHRVGYRKILEALLIEHIPGGARWRYVWGSCLTFVFVLQLITGVLLMTSYSAGDSTAWGSVYYIQYEMDFGWLIRGLHHFGSQAMVVLLCVHMLQVVIAGAHLPPREVNWWLGLALLGCVLGLSLTGYLLPWDQKGYWATQVATNIAGNLPGLGSWIQRIVVGGPAYGHQTLTHFHALHVAILPPLVIVLVIAHLVVFRRHGVTTPANCQGAGWFWPDQAFRDMVVSMLIFAVLIGLVLWGDGHAVATPGERSLWDRMAHAGRDGRGANLDAPADPSQPYPARPEWYFLFLFQLLKYFEGPNEIVGTVIIPNAVLVALALLPLLGYGRMRPLGWALGVLVVGGVLCCAAVLTFLALADDRADTAKAAKFREEQVMADRLGTRAIELARSGIPAQGAILLLERDPITQGPRLFGKYCATCHSHGSEFPNGNATSSDLAGFGAKDWTRGLLLEPDGPKYFGATKLRTMSNWVKRTRANAKKKNEEPALDAEFAQIADWLGTHPRGAIHPAFEARCNECHSYAGAGGTTESRGPDLTGYGDADWLRVMIMAPGSPRRYGPHNVMPAFRDLEGPAGGVTTLDAQQLKDTFLEQAGDDEKKKLQIEASTRLMHLGDVDRELIVRWLLGDDRAVFGGDPIAAATQR
jgi:ubiquinol-cytochrome c reductase cytochrome b subunit